MAGQADLAIIIRAQDHASPTLQSVGMGLGGLAKAGGAFSLGMSAVTGVIGLAGAAFGAAKGSIIDLNSSLEQSQVAFTTMLGSGEKASAFLKDLQKFAQSTPFEFPELVDASKKLLAMGFESQKVIPMMTAIGDSVAAVGGGKEMIDGVTMALGQMQSKGKVSAEEMGQLAERGIPAWDMLAKKLGVDIPTAMDMVSKGAVKADTFMAAFQEGVATRFGGMMEKQSQTFAGAMSTITDALTMSTATAFKPFFEMVSQGAIALAGFLTSEDFTKWGESITDVVQSVVVMMREAFRQISDAWRTLGQVFAGAWEPSDSIDPFVNAVGQVGIVLRDDVIPAVREVSAFIIEQFSTVTSWFSENWPLIQEVNAKVLDGLRGAWADEGGGSGLSNVVQVLLAAIKEIISTELSVILDLTKANLQIWNGDWRGALDTILAANQTFGQAVLDILYMMFGGSLSALQNWIGETVGAITTWATSTFLSPIQGLVSSATGAMEGVGSGMLGAISSSLSAIVSTLSGWVDGFLGLIRGLAGQAGSAAHEIGSAIVNGIISGVRSMGDSLGSILGGMVHGALQRAKAALDIDSPSKVFADQIGKPIVQGIIQPVEQGSRAFGDAIATMTRPPMAPSYASAGAPMAAATGGGGGGLTVIVQGPIYGFNDFEDKVVGAIESATRRARF